MDRSLFIIDKFENRKGAMRYRLVWAESGEIAEDYQGYGTKDPEVLERRSGVIIRERRERFCEENRELLSEVTSVKDVERVLSEANITIPLGLTPLKIFREVNGVNKKRRDNYVASHTDKNGNYWRSYSRKGHFYEELWSPDGELLSCVMDGNLIY